MAPAPRMTMLLGCFFISSASRLVITFLPSTFKPGSTRGTQPVANSTLVASIVWLLPSAVFTLILRSPPSFPSPTT